jgi:hypothetical protein
MSSFSSPRATTSASPRTPDATHRGSVLKSQSRRARYSTQAAPPTVDGRTALNIEDAPPVAPFDGARPTVRGQPRHEDTNGSAEAPLASPPDMPPSLDGIPNRRNPARDRQSSDGS